MMSPTFSHNDRYARQKKQAVRSACQRCHHTCRSVQPPPPQLPINNGHKRGPMSRAYLVDLGVEPAARDEARQLCVQQLGGNAEGGGHGGQHDARQVARGKGQDKTRRHVGHRYSDWECTAPPLPLVGLQELRVGQDSVLAHQIGGHRAQEAVRQDVAVHLQDLHVTRREDGRAGGRTDQSVREQGKGVSGEDRTGQHSAYRSKELSVVAVVDRAQQRLRAGQLSLNGDHVGIVDDLSYADKQANYGLRSE